MEWYYAKLYTGDNTNYLFFEYIVWNFLDDLFTKRNNRRILCPIWKASTLFGEIK